MARLIWLLLKMFTIAGKEETVSASMAIPGFRRTPKTSDLSFFVWDVPHEESFLVQNIVGSISPLSVDAERPRRPQNGQSPSHTDAIAKDVEFAAHDLSPPYRYLGDGDIGKFRQHEHLHVEDPALGVHVRHDVG